MKNASNLTEKQSPELDRLSPDRNLVDEDRGGDVGSCQTGMDRGATGRYYLFSTAILPSGTLLGKESIFYMGIDLLVLWRRYVRGGETGATLRTVTHHMGHGVRYLAVRCGG